MGITGLRTLGGKGGTGGGVSDKGLSMNVGVDADARGDCSTSVPRVPLGVDSDGALRIDPIILLPSPAVGVLGEEDGSDVEPRGLLLIGIAIVVGLSLSDGTRWGSIALAGGGRSVSATSPSDRGVVARPGGNVGVCWYG